MRRESTIAEALALVGLVLVLTVLASLAIPLFSPLVWFLLYQLVVIAVPLALFAYQRRDEFSFAITRPEALDAAAALLLGASVAIANIGLVIPLSPLTEGGDGGALAETLATPALPLALALFAVLPAITEELLFRGVLMRALEPRGPWIAIIVSAVLFSGFHFSIEQLPPLFLIGVAAGVAAVATRSVSSAIAVHLANNATAIGLLRLAPGDLELDLAVGVAAAFVALGAMAWLLLRARLR